ncbi:MULTISPECIES: glucan biosynthesis protein G [Aminobacterium]|jgi:glucans biosynthesis protein|uniref:glucan biosynthesis protein G n=1 Tax=Aminobacterium TaxID=81466 RepID=UPI0011D15AC9|nr:MULTISPECIES: glucan biosynthesis protein G [Aminobacterium]MDD3768416.1 glucan biosynthesis protein G [Aminobacterium colombiense]MDD4266282.1 glucan biosynthesis protein G [Aminobacterium colombiense]
MFLRRFLSHPKRYLVSLTLLINILTVPIPLFCAVQEEVGLAFVNHKAEGLALRPFEDPRGSVPKLLMELSYDQWRDIRFRPEKALWKEEKLPFSLQFFHLGMFYDRAVQINIVDKGKAVQFPFSTDLFDYGQNQIDLKKLPPNLGFAGFRIHFPINRPGYDDEVAVFLGASYFRAVAKNQQYGLSARGMAIDTASPTGEEFPWFKEFWLVKPTSRSSSLIVYALLDSPSCTGAYKFTITPGEETQMDVTCNIFKRKDMNKIGIAPSTSMFFYGETENGRPGDFRPEVHDSDGLLMETNGGKWIWRPLANPSRLLISRYKDVDVKGFGLMQRDLNFDHYLDLEARYEKRPSLWITPQNDWGEGHVELVEIPSDSEINDNIVAYWVPEPNGKLSFAYSMKWLTPHMDKDKPARAAHTRLVTEKEEGVYRFIIDFEGKELNAIPAETGLASDITVEGDAFLIERQLLKNPATTGWRLSFKIAVPVEKLKSIVPDRKPIVKLTAFLKKGENIPEPLTEIWTYDFRP